MPTRVEAETLHYALARLEEFDHDAAMDSRASLSWLGWDEEGPFLLRRYDLMLHLWYELPTKVSSPPEAKLAQAASLGQLLEMTPAAAYAPLCTAPDTQAQIERWETDERLARRELKRLLDASGLEPPNTPQFSWGSIIGVDEAQARDAVAFELELAVETGTLSPGTPGFKRHQAEFVDAALTRDGRLEAIHAERMRIWRDDRRSATRTEIIDRVAELVAQPQTDDPQGEAGSMARWLLERAVDGITLTQTGALNRAFVREAAELRPEWWDAPLFGPPNREDDVLPLAHLDDLLSEMRLLRRSGRRVVATGRARALLSEPTVLADACASALFAGETFEAAVAELASALLIAGEPVDIDRLGASIYDALLEGGWQSGGRPPSVLVVSGTIARLFFDLEALDLVQGTRREGLSLTPGGHRALSAGLRSRALAPRTRF